MRALLMLYSCTVNGIGPVETESSEEVVGAYLIEKGDHGPALA
jgi:hypothetical protein